MEKCLAVVGKLTTLVNVRALRSSIAGKAPVLFHSEMVLWGSHSFLINIISKLKG